MSPTAERLRDHGADDRVIDRMSGAGRVSRHCAAALAAALLLGTTLFGQDSDFPFAPFRMYATRDDPNGVIRILAVEAVAPDGAVTDVTDAHGAPRRAELEGRIDALREDPGLLASLAPLYLAAATDTSTLRVVWREYRLSDGRSRPPQDRILASIDVSDPK
ncbi:MAG: hypothetical protein JWN20_1387 [Jatrophihabitantaceae bacterium]|nr:hypothetical protein [Jatrophihabitantaceae bacterium]